MKAVEFKTEADLCDAFISWALKQGWTSYAETGGFDILLVKDGTQVAVEAKLKFNTTVLGQILPSRYGHDLEHGPDFRAVLVPLAAAGGEEIPNPPGPNIIGNPKGIVETIIGDPLNAPSISHDRI